MMSGNNIRALLASTAILGPMTPMERAAGRYMRAPDHGADDAAYADFAKSGEVEVGATKDAIESNVTPPKEGEEEKPPKTKASGKAPKEKPAAAAETKAKPGEEGADKPENEVENEDEDDEDGEEEKPEKKPKKASDRIRELNTRVRQRDRVIEQLSARMEAIEKGGLSANGKGGSNTGTARPAPDPLDQGEDGKPLYPLGHLDDRYIEDKLEWLAENKAGAQADAVLHRQQETERQQAAERQQTALLEKVDDLSTRGSEQFDDFQEAVIESGMRGDWDLGQPTFEAAHEAENGAQILYDLSQDKKEAKRVAALSSFQQIKFVLDRDAAITAKTKPRTKPGADAPPSTKTRGANSSHRINPATDDLGAFEKAWLADEKGGN